MSLSSIGVVIPAYRSAASIAATLDAVAAQTVAPAGVVVVVDGPDEATATAARAHPSGVEVVVLPRNTGGPGAPRNVGAARLLDRHTLDAIWFLDADDVPDPRFIEVVMEAMCAHPEADLVATGFAHWDPAGRPPSPVEAAPAAPAPIDLDWYLAHTGSVLPSFSVIRCRASTGLRDGGRPFDETLRTNQDYDAFVRLLHLGRGVRLDRSGGAYRLHSGGISANGVAAWLCRLATDEGLVRWFEARGESAMADRFRRAAGSALRTAARHLWRRNEPGDRATAARLLVDDWCDGDPRSLAVLASLALGVDRRARAIARHGDARRSG